MKALIAALCAASTLLAACSSSSSGIPDSATTNGPMTQSDVTHGGPAPARAVPNLKAKLLKITDLPTGWSVDNSDSNDDSDDATGCGGTVDLAHRSTASKDASFVDEGGIPDLGETVAYFATDAEAVMTQGIKAFNDCKKLTITNDGEKVTANLGEMSFPKVGEQSGAWSMTMTVQGFDVSLAIVAFRKGDIITLLDYIDLGSVDIDQLQRFVRQAAAKI